MTYFYQAVWLTACVVTGCSGVGQVKQPLIGRPSFYSPTFPQFAVESWEDPRVVTVFRFGAGNARRPEFSVFEVVDEGNQLRMLYRAELLNDYLPACWFSLCAGRFLVTMSEFGGRHGASGNCVVVYDLARGVSKSWRAEEFLPKDRLDMGGVRENRFLSGTSLVDSKRMLFIPNDPAICVAEGYPFIVVDMASMSIRYDACPPDALPKECRKIVGASIASWAWSMGSGSEPPWQERLCMPMLLKGVACQGKDELLPIGRESQFFYFMYLDGKNEYQRVSKDMWRDPPSNWAEHDPASKSVELAPMKGNGAKKGE